MISTSGQLWAKLDRFHAERGRCLASELDRQERLHKRLEVNERVALKLRVKRFRDKLKKPVPGTIASIIYEVAAKHGITVAAIKSPLRHRRFVKARFEACFEAARRTNHPYTAIGRHMGKRDHTTIMYAVKAHAKRTGKPHPRRADTFEQVGIPLNRALSKIAKGKPLDGEE